MVGLEGLSAKVFVSLKLVSVVIKMVAEKLSGSKARYGFTLFVST